MEKSIVRLLKADEIECRAAAVTEKGVSLLLYKDARVDQKILDETFGAFGWKRSHQYIGESLYCTVEIYDKESGTWVAKQDVGTTGYTEKEKSLASDSFKRACFNWGIGRELYTAPFIFIPADKTDVKKREERYVCNDHFSIRSIEYGTDRDITGLIIANGSGKVVYEYRAEGAVKKGKEPGLSDKTLSPKQINSLNAELDRTGVTMESVQQRYQVQEPEAMSEELYRKVMAALSKTKTKAA